MIDGTQSLSTRELSVNDLRGQMVGIEQQVPLIDGSMRQYVYLDNAASTPSFVGVQDKVNEALLWYSSVHRGSGFKSLLSTHAYDRAREVVMEFVGGNPDHDVVVFGKNTSEVINIVASCGNWQPGDVVIATLMEHHSNDLPWRAVAQVEYAGVDACGCFDLNDLEDKLKRYAGRVKMVACTGASNVTGFTPPVHAVAELAHRYGALMLADCAQLAPHRAQRQGGHAREHGAQDHARERRRQAGQVHVLEPQHPRHVPVGTHRDERTPQEQRTPLLEHRDARAAVHGRVQARDRHAVQQHARSTGLDASPDRGRAVGRDGRPRDPPGVVARVDEQRPRLVGRDGQAQGRAGGGRGDPPRRFGNVLPRR